MIFSHKKNIFAIFSGYNLLIYHLILFTKTIVSILCDVDSKMYKKYLELKWDRLYSTLRLEGSDLRSNRKILILKRSFHAEPKLTWKFDRQVILVSSLKHFTWRVDTVLMVVMYFVGLPSNSDKNEKLPMSPMSSFVEGLRLLSKMKKYRYFWTSKLQKTSETSDGSHSRKNRQSLKSTY